jgi:MoaA/NifB/PqqE/SkfB family radical SAM enzyme
MKLTAVTAYRLARALARARVGKKSPVFCSWFVTSRCNLKCRGCIYYEQFPAEKEMDTGEARRFVDDLAAAGIPFLIYLGGEPLVRRDIFDIAAHARGRGIYQVMFTNGIKVDLATARRLCAMLEKVIFSIDGPRPANDHVRGKGSFEKAMAGLTTFLEARDRATGCYVSVGINEKSWPQIPAFLEELRRMGVDRAKLQPNFLPGYRPDNSEVAPVLAKLLAYAREHPSFFAADERFLRDLRTFFGRENNLDFCGATMLSHIAVTADGTVSACCDHFVPLGSVRGESLAAILAKDHTAALRKVAECPGCVRRDYQIYRRFALDPLWTLRPADFRMLKNL